MPTAIGNSSQDGARVTASMAFKRKKALAVLQARKRGMKPTTGMKPMMPAKKMPLRRMP